MSDVGDVRVFAIGFGLALMAVAHFVLATLAFLQDGNRNPARRWLGYMAVTSALMCVSMSFSYFASYAGHDYEFAYRFTWQGYLGLPIIYQLALLHFPTVSRWRVWLVRGLFVFWSAIFVIVMTTNWIEHAPDTLLPYHKVPLRYETPVRGVAAICMIFIVIEIIRARNNAVAVRRNKSNFFLIGLLLYSIGGFVSAGPLQNLFGLQLDPGLACVFSLPWVALTYYAVTRHRLFDLRLALSRVLSLVFVALATAILTVLIVQPFRRFGNGALPLFIATFIASAIIASSQLFAVTFEFLKGVFLRHAYDFEEMLRRASEINSSLLNVDEIERRFAKLTREALGVSTEFFLRTAPTPTTGIAELTEWFGHHHTSYVKEEREHDENAPQLIAIAEYLTSLGAEVAVPAFYQQRLFGFILLSAKHDGEAFTERDIRLLETMIGQVALSVENARLFAEATTDGLTDLYHQKYLKTRLKSEFEKVKGTPRTLGIIIIDVDFFKKVNDTFGHLVGDEVLKEVAGILRKSFKAEDVVARYGGEEFAVLLLDPQPQSIYDIAERIRGKIAAHKFPRDIPVTVSAGVHHFVSADTATNELELLGKADQALYAAKHGGRNRVVVWNPTLAG